MQQENKPPAKPGKRLPDKVAVPPPKIRLDRQDIVEQHGANVGFQYVSIVRPLELYQTRGWIEERQYEAGKRLHDTWWYGCVRSPYVQHQYRESSGIRSLQCVPLGAFAIEYRDAMLAIDGVPARRVAYRVCCEPEDYAGEGKPMRLLKHALDDLIRHWGL